MTNEDLKKHINDEHDTSKHSDETVAVDDRIERPEHSIGGQEMARKLRVMEDSYDRLMVLFKRKQSEHNDKAVAFKVELEEVNERLRVIKTENEKLKEVNETQHKLWKIFVENVEKGKNWNIDRNTGEHTSRQEVAEKEPAANDVEIPEDDEEPDEIQTEAAYQEWLKDIRGRGFKRSNPASPAEKIVVSNGRPKQSYLEAAATGSHTSRPPAGLRAGPPPSSSTSPPCPPSPTTQRST